METQQDSGSGLLDVSGSFLENEKSTVMSKSFNHLTSPKQQNRRHTRESEINQRLLNQNNNLLIQNENLKQLTINKLRYDSLQLVGREKEIQLLKSILDDAVNKRTSKRKEVVFIGGYSGVGKSALADRVGEYVATLDGGIFLRGKFGMNNYDEPYSAIAEAFNGFFQEMKEFQLKEEEKSNEAFADLRDLLTTELGSELHLLANLIPSLETIADSRPKSLAESHDDDAGNKRWKYAFRVLTRVLSNYFSPMVLLLEDLQWIDVSSLEIIYLLITDSQNPNPLVVVGNFRSNEVDEDHILFEHRKRLLRKQEAFNFKLTDVQLGSLDVDDVNKVVMTMLSIDDPEKTRSLTDICFKRTLGNPYFVIEYMTLLEEEKLISYNFGLMSWTWDDSSIETVTMSTANVVDLLQSRMKKLPEDSQMLLQYAACLGSSFKTSMVALVWREHSGKIGNADGLTSMLDVLEEGNYIEKSGTDAYCWVHDKVQEAALSFGKASSPSFQFEIGSLLFHCLSETELDVALFDVVNLVNKGQVPRRPEYAELNLRASQKARKISAFHSAAIFANNGIRLLPNDKFSSNRQLALSLYTIGAEMNYAIGDMEQMELYTEAVLSQEVYSILDKFPLYMAKATKITVADANYKETIVLCIHVLKMLGCNLDYSRALMPLVATKQLVQKMRMLKKRKRDSYAELGQMTNEKDRAIMSVLTRLAASSYHENDNFMHALSTCEQVQMTLKCGISEVSGNPFCAMGIIALALKEDYALAIELGETALFIESTIDNEFTATMTNLLAYAFVFSWTKNLSSCCKDLSKTYTLGMRSGNTEHAMWAITFAEVFLPFQMGKKLDSILFKCPGCLAQMEELKQHDQPQVIQLYQNGMLILKGELDQDRLIPNNDQSLDLSSSIRSPSNTRVSPLCIVSTDFIQMLLYLVFGRIEEAAARAIQSGDQFSKTVPGHPAGMMEIFYRALSMYAMARQTKKRKYKLRAKRIHKIITRWAKKGNPNVQHYNGVLNAEKAALDKKHKEAEAFYKSAIVLAGRSGFIHDAALINERYASYMTEIGDEDEAKYRIQEAIRFYRDWGADAKVELLSRAMS